jgi:hypothetical protein
MALSVTALGGDRTLLARARYGWFAPIPVAQTLARFAESRRNASPDSGQMVLSISGNGSITRL